MIDELATRRRLEDVQIEAAGALIGTCMGHGESGPQWTEAFHEGFRAAVRIAFDAGLKIGTSDQEESHG